MLKTFFLKFASIIDDLFYAAGCLLILKGVYEVLPVATWFVAGGMAIVTSVIIARSRQ